MTDTGVAEFYETKRMNDDKDTHYIGMRHKTTGVPHGILRWVQSNGDIFAATFKDGKKHGLFRMVGRGYVCIKLYKNDVPIANLHFRSDFTETVRNGPKVHLFKSLQPTDFKL